MEFVHHFQRDVVGQVPVFMSELLQELVKQHALWTSTQQFFLDDHVHRYRPISTSRCQQSQGSHDVTMRA